MTYSVEATLEGTAVPSFLRWTRLGTHRAAKSSLGTHRAVIWGLEECA